MPGTEPSDGRLPSGILEPWHLGNLDASESWEDRMSQTRKLFFKLYGVQAEGSFTSNCQGQERASVPSASYASGSGTSSTADTEAAYEEKTLVKFHHVDHFTFSYLFPVDFRIYSVRKLTDLSSLLSDGEPMGAFGYGLAGRGGRRGIISASTWTFPLRQMHGRRVLGSGLGRGAIASLMTPRSRFRSACDLQPRRGLRQDDGLPQVVEFPGPLVPLSAFFAKSRDPVCRGFRKLAMAAMTQEPEALSSAAVPRTLTLSFVFVLGALNVVNLDFF